MQLKTMLSTVLFLAVITPAFAQGLDDTGRPLRVLPGDNAPARVQSSLTMTIPVKDGEDPAAQQEAGLRSFYKVAAGSCAMVLETIGDSCEVTSVTSNVNVRDRALGGGIPSQITINGQIAMKVTFKPALGKPAP